MAQIRSFNEADINCATVGNNSIVAAVSGRPIVVWKIFLVAAGAVNIKFLDGTTALNAAAIPLAAAGSTFTLLHEGSPHFETAPGNAFVLNLGAGVQVTGRVYYTTG